VLTILALAACADEPTRTHAPVTAAPGASLDVAATATGPVVAIDADGGHTCALKVDRTLVCWGYNGNGESSPPSGFFTQVSAGASYTCAVRVDQSIACWGNNFAGKADPPSGSFTQVSAGVEHTCAVRTDGTVACWGYNSDGQRDVPSGLTGVVQVSVGEFYSCALKSDGTLRCWGSDSWGLASPPGGTFTQVSAGYFHTCALRTDGTLACWGVDIPGVAIAPAGTFTQVGAGKDFTCAVKVDGSIACWGTSHFRAGPPPTGAFTQASVGFDFVCALTVAGTVACWGENERGELDVPPDIVADLTPPSITVPANITVDATSPGGAVVTYTVSFSDNVGVISQGCTPASGSVFAIGATTVTCTAADAAGNSATASFTVTVKGAAEQAADLGQSIQGLDLPDGTATSLSAKLNAALAALAAGNTAAACSQLDAMINQINANVPNKISRADADALIAEINGIRAAAGC
jgi:hypothetical protein